MVSSLAATAEKLLKNTKKMSLVQKTVCISISNYNLLHVKPVKYYNAGNEEKLLNFPLIINN